MSNGLQPGDQSVLTPKCDRPDPLLLDPLAVDRQIAIEN